MELAGVALAWARSHGLLELMGGGRGSVPIVLVRSSPVAIGVVAISAWTIGSAVAPVDIISVFMILDVGSMRAGLCTNPTIQMPVHKCLVFNPGQRLI